MTKKRRKPNQQPKRTVSSVPIHLNQELNRVLNGDQSITKASLQISRSGPLPIPQELKDYGDVDSGFPERIMRMAEKSQEIKEYEIKRVRDNEELEVQGRNRIIDGFNKATMTRMWLEFAIVLISFGVTIYLFYKFENVMLASSAFIPVVIIFLSKLVASYFNKQTKDKA